MPAKIDAALKALYASGLFEDVRISQSGGRLIVTVVEAPVIDRLAFEGNSRIKDEQLQQEIQSKARGTLSRATVQADVQRIIEVYHRNGRFDVTVVPKIIERPNNRVDLVFEVKEGEKTGIKSIIFVGNHAYSDYRLRDVIKTSESNWLSFLQTTDVYDADRIEADRDLIRRFYLSHGYADVQVVSATGEYDPSRKGFIITFTIEEGPLYHFGVVDVQSNIRAVDPADAAVRPADASGDIYNGDAVEKTVEEVTVEIARHGYPFATVRPRGDRNPQQRTIGVVYVVDEGVRAYIERINIRGNTRTRDYVIRREFDISEGDPYNRALIDRAERRIKNLNFFKTVKITNEPGSAPDRVVINVDRRGAIDRRVLGHGRLFDRGRLDGAGFGRRAQPVRHRPLRQDLGHLWAVHSRRRTELRRALFSRPAHVAAASTCLPGRRSPTPISRTARKRLAALSSSAFRCARICRCSCAIRCSRRRSSCRRSWTIVNNINPDFVNTFPTPNAIQPRACRAMARSGRATTAPAIGCFASSQASLPIRLELAHGAFLTSLAGYGLTYNTLDNNKHPTGGLLLSFGQDFAGLGGDVAYMRTVADFRTYYEVVSDLVGVVHLQGGNMIGLSGAGTVRMLDDFKMGPNLVRGFQPAGIGPRDITPGTTGDALGGTLYWGASVELQYPFFFLPKDSGLRGAVFVDSGSVWDYKGETSNPATGEINGVIAGDRRFLRLRQLCACSSRIAPRCAPRSAPA